MSNTINNKVASLDKVVQISNAQGANYTPSNAALQSAALVALLLLAKEKNDAVISAHIASAMAINHRQESFGGIPKLVSVVTRMVSASAASKMEKEEAKMIRARFFSKPSAKSDTKPQNEAQAPLPTRSGSNRDRISIMSNFKELVKFLEQVPTYNPVEPAFTIAGLKAKLAELEATQLACVQAKINLSNARGAMATILKGENGVLETTRLVKHYIRAKFGTSGVESRQVNDSTNF